MTFYNDIAKYYDNIFPVSKDTVEFIMNSIGSPPKSVLDVACGTGAYSIELDKNGYNLIAIDIDSKIIEYLSANNRKSKVKFWQADMLKLHEKFNDNMFDAIYCIGNSLVHLDNLNEIKNFFISVRKLLVRNGVFIFQIINYDKIISKDIKSLPTIVNKSIPLNFERLYRYEKTTHKIVFKTILSVENKRIENEIYLTPLMCDEAIYLLKDVGFKEINVYGDFKKNSFDKDNSYSLIIEAR
ncbi:class I SAM-dependent methyltransferase [Clostridium butyricum]|uniref:class I SAM-dependent methyltransferase n=1 Tax=Clostridium butyricum TaxID=1492 RepID=UPI003567DB19|nr:class I SAM-dependent methyltransferase [Clostridium botulinum]